MAAPCKFLSFASVILAVSLILHLTLNVFNIIMFVYIQNPTSNKKANWLQ